MDISIQSCSFCGQGLLHFWKNEETGSVVALCDECELIWPDLDDLEGKVSEPYSCPDNDLAENWHQLTEADIVGDHELISILSEKEKNPGAGNIS